MASSSLSSSVRTKVISTFAALASFLSSIDSYTTLYVDLEGQNLSRHGTLTLVTILVRSQMWRIVAIVDVQTLGHRAFTTPSSAQPSRTLKSILEDPTIPKYFWDVRNDADALKALYDVSIAGVTDIQLLENATRFGSKTYLRGLNVSVQRDLDLDNLDKAHWVMIKQQGSALMDSATSIFSVRPMAPATVSYCVGDVEYLPQLRNEYLHRYSCTASRLAKVKEESARRVREAHTSWYQPHGQDKKLGPWGDNGI
ncbi:hypothetical protein CONLIGDRAFT_699551 [Coniochaeta ligniaria NRRL 30616]|uniref:3'-5' exonuclease domain-containing protein n=1 Tax=Coniochaeta ligniaria NRRL 30616 TaxID=1408157 RepID=A0A1J7IY38_9PEZI|nr:hypothetical protein CONLIGDRAFT_699551 [Coniochaeta ligniaria NRRL 30616]